MLHCYLHWYQTNFLLEKLHRSVKWSWIELQYRFVNEQKPHSIFVSTINIPCFIVHEAIRYNWLCVFARTLSLVFVCYPIYALRQIFISLLKVNRSPMIAIYASNLMWSFFYANKNTGCECIFDDATTFKVKLNAVMQGAQVLTMWLLVIFLLTF